MLRAFFILRVVSWAVSFLWLLPLIPLTFETYLHPFSAFLIPPLTNLYPVATPLQYAPDKVQKILVGNKSDEMERRQVATAQGLKVGQKLSLAEFLLSWQLYCTQNCINQS